MDYLVKHDVNFNTYKSDRMSGFGGPLFEVEQIPEPFHELFILKGYRHPQSSVKQCILSLFDATNETLNFWTHFLPSCYFMYTLKGLSESLDFKHDSYTWPLLAYLFVCCIFPLVSAVAHTFNTMSDTARHVFFFLDYSAVSSFSFGVAMAYRAYSAPAVMRTTWLGEHFIMGGALSGIICTSLSCQTRFMKPSTFRKLLRVVAFAVPYLYGAIPLFIRLLMCLPEECHLTANNIHIRQFFFAFVAAFLYSTHFPERMFPGSFDIVGHSHQLFHISSILATIFQQQAVLQDMKERKEYLTAAWDFSSLKDSIGMMAILLIANAFVVMFYSLKLLRMKKKLM